MTEEAESGVRSAVSYKEGELADQAEALWFQQKALTEGFVAWENQIAKTLEQSASKEASSTSLLPI